MPLLEKVVVVTGGCRGLGRSMAFALAAAGARVVVASPSAVQLRETAAGINALHGPDRALAVSTDITLRDDCEKLLAETLAHFGAAHVLVNNARRPQRGPGLPPDGNTLPFWESDPAIWQEAINVNVFGTFLISHVFTPHFLEQGWGRIINITTSLRTMQRKNNTPYGVSKAAVETATMIWAKDLAGTGVTVNSLHPGGRVNTDPNRPVSPDVVAQPVDIMNGAVVWLSSNDSDGQTGGRYIGKDWDGTLAPAEAAARALEAPVLRPA